MCYYLLCALPSWWVCLKIWCPFHPMVFPFFEKTNHDVPILNVNLAAYPVLVRWCWVARHGFLLVNFPSQTNRTKYLPEHMRACGLPCSTLHLRWGRRILSSHFPAITSKTVARWSSPGPPLQPRAQFFCCVSLLETMTVLFFAFHTDDPRFSVSAMGGYGDPKWGS